MLRQALRLPSQALRAALERIYYKCRGFSLRSTRFLQRRGRYS